MIPEHRDTGKSERIRKEFDMALTTGTSRFFSQKIEAEICRPDGTRRRIQQTVFPIKTARGFRLGSITRDVTDLNDL
jgi:hypothetical protein